MTKSFEEEATKVLLKLTARSVMSPFQGMYIRYCKQKELNFEENTGVGANYMCI